MAGMLDRIQRCKLKKCKGKCVFFILPEQVDESWNDADELLRVEAGRDEERANHGYQEDGGGRTREIQIIFL